jgi:hypothetical protein
MSSNGPEVKPPRGKPRGTLAKESEPCGILGVPVLENPAKGRIERADVLCLNRRGEFGHSNGPNLEQANEFHTVSERALA